MSPASNGAGLLLPYLWLAAAAILAVLASRRIPLPGILRHSRVFARAAWSLFLIPLAFSFAALAPGPVGMLAAGAVFVGLSMLWLSAAVANPLWARCRRNLQRRLEQGAAWEVQQALDAVRCAVSMKDQWQWALLYSSALAAQGRPLAAYQVLDGHGAGKLFARERHQRDRRLLPLLLSLGCPQSAQALAASLHAGGNGERALWESQYLYLQGQVAAAEEHLQNGLVQLQPAATTAGCPRRTVAPGLYCLAAWAAERCSWGEHEERLQQALAEARADRRPLWVSKTYLALFRLWLREDRLGDAAALYEQWSRWRSERPFFVQGSLDQLLARLEAGPQGLWESGISHHPQHWDASLREKLSGRQRLHYHRQVIEAASRGGWPPDYWLVRSLGLFSDYRRAAMPTRYQGMAAIYGLLEEFRGAPHDFQHSMETPIRLYMQDRALTDLDGWYRRLPQEAVDGRAWSLWEQVRVRERFLESQNAGETYGLYRALVQLYRSAQRRYLAWKAHLVWAEDAAARHDDSIAAEQLRYLEVNMEPFAEHPEMAENFLRMAYCATLIQDIAAARRYWRRFSGHPGQPSCRSHWLQEYYAVVQRYLTPSLGS